MPDGDHLPSDHPTIETVRAPVVHHVGSRYRLDLPVADGIPDPGTVVRVLLDERTRFARIAGGAGDSRWIAAVVGSADDARNGAPDAHLDDWLAAHGLTMNRSVLVDLLVDDYAIGLRPPGERRVYPIIDPPDRGLADIARDLEG